MKTKMLTSFIDKYYLSGEAPSVVWKSDLSKKQLFTKFVNEKKTLLGEVTMDNSDLETGDVGIYNTDILKSQLMYLKDDIEIFFTKSEDKFLSLKAKDSLSEIQYMLSDTTVIPVPPDLKNIPNYELKIGLNSNTMSKFTKGQGALKDVEKFTILTDNKKVRFVIGYSTNHTNRITIPMMPTEYNEIDKISFNAKYFSDIFQANMECENGLIEISSEGVAKLSFKVDNLTSVYWVVASQDND